MGNSIALFDFDGTLTTKDSFLEAIKFYKGKVNFAIGFAVLMPVLILYKLKLMTNWEAKQMVLKYFWGGTPVSEFERISNNFAIQEIPKLLRKEAFDRLNWHKAQNHRIVVVSASASAWIKGWTNAQNIELISSEMEVIQERVTGNLLGKNCYGAEKVAQIKKRITLADYTEIYAYGDTVGDREMLALATYPYYRRFS